MKSYRKKEKKNHILTKIMLQLLLIFTIATMSIVLYDMYINIDVDVEKETYTAEKTSKEISIQNTQDVSTMLEKVSKSVVRNFKNRK